MASEGILERLELLQRMHRQWPFFRTLLSNLDMVLAKSDLRIAARYVELVEDKAVAKRIYGLLRAEWQRADAGLALITGESRGKLWRTKLAKTAAGYVARTDLVAALWLDGDGFDPVQRVLQSEKRT